MSELQREELVDIADRMLSLQRSSRRRLGSLAGVAELLRSQTHRCSPGTVNPNQFEVRILQLKVIQYLSISLRSICEILTREIRMSYITEETTSKHASPQFVDP
jgi:hypothetical protein